MRYRTVSSLAAAFIALSISMTLASAQTAPECPNYLEPAPQSDLGYSLGAGVPDGSVYGGDVAAGGPIDVTNCGIDHSGYVSATAGLDFHWLSSDVGLTFKTTQSNWTASSVSIDTVLLVQAPNGVTYFNDDGADDTRYSRIDIPVAYAIAGTYQVWVGTYAPDTRGTQVRVAITVASD